MGVLFLAVGGAGGYLYFEQTAVASFGAASEEAIAAKKQREADAKSAQEKAKNLRFVDLKPIVLPIIDESGVIQVVTFVVTLEVEGDENADYVKSLSPRLKDAYIQDMYGMLNRKAAMDGGMVRVDRLKDRLNKLSQKILGTDKINGVLLQVVNQRPV